MRRPFPRNLTLVLPSIVAAILAGFLIAPPSAMADDTAKPAKKDNPKALQPAQATLTASVEPAEAKPGDVVTFKVTAKLDSGFHIYKYSKEQGSGPVPTSFDFFDRAGLELDGDWTASREPEKHKDPNFPDVDSVEYYEDEVDLEHQAQGPRGAAARKENAPLPGAVHDLRRQDLQHPGALDASRRRADRARRRRRAARSGQRSHCLSRSPLSPPRRTATRRSGPPRRRFTTSIEPAQAKPGDAVTFKVTAKLEPGYHIYQYSKVAGPGPVATSFDFFDRGGLELDGDWTASRAPIKHKDPNFEEVPFVEYFEDEVTWSIKLKVPAGARRARKCRPLPGALHDLRRDDLQPAGVLDAS